MAVGRDRHSTSPRVYITEELILDPNAIIKYGVPGSGTDPTYPWRAMYAAIEVRGGGANNPSWSATGLGNISAYEFSATVMKEVWMTFHVPFDYTAGSSLHMSLHWMNASATPDTGDVRWGFEYSVVNANSGAFPAPTTIYALQASNATQFYHAKTEFADISDGWTPGALVLGRIFRDAADVLDTCTDAVFLLEADVHYQSGTLGEYSLHEGV